MTQNDGGPAFPVYMDSRKRGMSLRDWFAGQALAGMAANPDCTRLRDEKVAQNSYDLADAMLAARGAKDGGNV